MGNRRLYRTFIAVNVPAIDDLRALDAPERVQALREIDQAAQVLAEGRGALEALLLEPPPVSPLIDAVEAGRQLGMSDEWVRLHGRELDIEVYVSEGVYRYDPERVLALRARRRPAPAPDPVMANLKRKLRQ
jgi:hypothetical protein